MSCKSDIGQAPTPYEPINNIPGIKTQQMATAPRNCIIRGWSLALVQSMNVAAGDLWHIAESRAARRVPRFNTDRAQTLRTMDKVEQLARESGARVILQHVPGDFDALPRSGRSALGRKLDPHRSRGDGGFIVQRVWFEKRGRWFALFRSEESVNVRKGNGTGQIRERPLLGDLVRRLQKACPGRSGECTTDANPSHALFRELCDGGKIVADSHIAGFGSARRDHSGDV